ncbi:hypothetical protein BJX76DRAFT_343970 [Aspergillus varians]
MSGLRDVARVQMTRKKSTKKVLLSLFSLHHGFLLCLVIFFFLSLSTKRKRKTGLEPGTDPEGLKEGNRLGPAVASHSRIDDS